MKIIAAKRFYDLADRLAGKKKSPEWMILTILQNDFPERIMK